MNDDVIPLNEIGKIETVKVYNQAYVDKQQKRIVELEKELEQAKKVQVVEHFEAYGQCRDSRRIASLETENAELKDKLKNLSKVAEVRLANWQKYEKELKSEKEYSATLRKEIDEYTDSHTLCAKYKELQKACDETQELLDKQIEATYELDKENAEQKKKIENLQKYLDTQNCYRECAETWVKLTKAKELIRQLCLMVRELNNPNVQLTNVDYSLSEAEQFIKECE